jgi:hypothetical protein
MGLLRLLVLLVIAVRVHVATMHVAVMRVLTRQRRHGSQSLQRCAASEHEHHEEAKPSKIHAAMLLEYDMDVSFLARFLASG